MNSKQIKEKLLAHLLFNKGFHAAFTEVSGADVFAITRSKYTHEFEIKVSKSDLMSELNCVNDLRLFGEPKKYYSKRTKHMAYLNQKCGVSDYMWEVLQQDRPNKFSFVVPGFLVSTALIYLESTPYGLYEIKEHWLENHKKADFIHREKASDELFFYLLRKASTEVQQLRMKAISRELTLNPK